MTGRTLATGRNATLVKLAFAAAAKFSAAFIAFGLTVVVTRNMPVDEAGLFLLGFSILAVLSVFFRLGLDNVILRLLSSHGTDVFAQEKLNRGLLWIVTLVVPATALGMIFSSQIATDIFNKPAFGPVLFWMLLGLPAMAIFMLLAMAFQAQHRVVLTTIFQNLGISTVFVVTFGYLWVEKPEVLNAVTAAQIYSGAAGVILLAALITWFGQKGISFTLQDYKDKELSSASANLWVATSMQLVSMWAGVIIAGAMVSAEELAYLSAAQRTAMLTSFVLMVVNMVVAPRYARLWKEGDIERIQYLAKWSTRGMIAMVLPVVFIMITWSDKIMGFFGEGFEDAYTLLIIMVVGQFVNVSSGTVGYLLQMTGHEREVKKSMIYSGVITLILTVYLINDFGVLGASFSISIGVIILNIMMLYYVKSRLKFYPFG